MPLKNSEEAYEKIIEISNNNDYTAGNLLDWLFQKNLQANCNWTKLKDPQQINFIGKLLENTKATMFFMTEKSKETTFKFLQNSVTII